MDCPAYYTSRTNTQLLVVIALHGMDKDVPDQDKTEYLVQYYRSCFKLLEDRVLEVAVDRIKRTHGVQHPTRMSLFEPPS